MNRVEIFKYISSKLPKEYSLEIELFLILEEFNDYKYAYRWFIFRSNFFRDQRRKALEFYGRKCSQCGSNKKLQVHHIRYRHLFDVTLSDLCVLCSKCHKNLHFNTIGGSRVPVIRS